MNIGLVTIAALLLLLPGVGFVVGVNFADKNVREIVFRNTPAEIGYVLVISLIVHLSFAYLAMKIGSLSEFNTAHLYASYLTFERAGAAVSDRDALAFLVASLWYYLVATVTGFVPGLGLGLMVRRRPKGPIGRFLGRFTSSFVKHRWMLQLIQRDQGVRASVLLKDPFAHIEKCLLRRICGRFSP
jgi:hypothetical protein